MQYIINYSTLLIKEQPQSKTLKDLTQRIKAACFCHVCNKYDCGENNVADNFKVISYSIISEDSILSKIECEIMINEATIKNCNIDFNECHIKQRKARKEQIRKLLKDN
jgi:hypothetical protein